MAEGNTVSQDDVVCRFFLNSSCRDGDKCPISHDITRTVPDTVCRYHLENRCFFGSNCRFDHVDLDIINASKTTKKRNKPSVGATNSDAGHHGKGNGARRARDKFTTLHRNNQKKDAAATTSTGPGSPNWVNAPEFVPKAPRSYADTVKAHGVLPEPDRWFVGELCPYYIMGECPLAASDCAMIHGDMCELCNKPCLHPTDEEQRKEHIDICEKEFVKDMELSFAMQRSRDKTCGICMDVIMEKEPISERRFGILEKCNHVFCLSCIRRWRQQRQFESPHHIDSMLDPVVTRACPECRVASDFVTPSSYWFDTEEEKAKMIKDYKEAMSKKPCKYFKQGRGSCPFGGACFYLHAKPDGTKVELPPPQRRRRQNQDGEFDFERNLLLWDFLEVREESILMHLELGMEDLLWSDSDDDGSDSSENFLFYP